MRKVREMDKKKEIPLQTFRGKRMETLERKKVTILYYGGDCGGGGGGGGMAVVAWVVPLPHTLVWSKAVSPSRIEKRPKTASCSTSSFRCSRRRPRRLKDGPNC